MYNFLQARLTPSQQNPAMGILPPYSIVFKPFLSVPTGFNASGSDFIRVGNNSDDDAYGTDINVASAITLSEFTAGVAVGFTQNGQEVFAKYNYTGIAPTTGEAIVCLPYIRVRQS